MHCLTLHQPWASLIAFGEKRIETRHWSTPHRGDLAIHAGRLTEDAALTCQMPPYALLLGRNGVRSAGDLPWGAVIATARLVDCVSTSSLRTLQPWRHLLTEEELELGDFTPGRFAWVLDDVRSLPEPVLIRGYQGLWEWEEAAMTDDPSTRAGQAGR